MCCLWWPDEVAIGRSGPVPRGFHDGGTAVADAPGLLTTVTVPLWACWDSSGSWSRCLWTFLLTPEAGVWTAVWVVIGLGFGGLLWAWAGGGTAQAYLAGYLIEKSLSLDNVFVFAVIFAAFAIPARYQHRVLMLGIVGALIMRAGFIIGGVTLLGVFHPPPTCSVPCCWSPRRDAARRRPAAARAQPRASGHAADPAATGQLHGQRFVVRDGRRLLATPLLLTGWWSRSPT